MKTSDFFNSNVFVKTYKAALPIDLESIDLQRLFIHHLDPLQHRQEGMMPKQRKALQIAGILLLLCAVFFFISFVSHLLYWKNDQDKIYYPIYQYLFNNEITVKNWMGKLGAWASFVFFHQLFGLSAFLFSFICFLAGVNVLFNMPLSMLKKLYFQTFFHLFLTPITLALLLPAQYLFLAGAYGYSSAEWLQSVLGQPGSFFLLVFIYITYLIIAFNLDIENLAKKIFTPSPKNIPSTNTQNHIAAEKKETTSPPHSDSSTNVSENAPPPSPPPPAEEEIISQTGDIEFKIEKNTSQETLLSEEEIAQKILAEAGEYDPTMELSGYQFPPLDLLDNYSTQQPSIDKEELEKNKQKIVSTLDNYNIQIQSIKATIGPTVTLYEIIPAPGIRISKIKNLENDIALSLSALGIRIIAPIPGKGTIGIEVPNQHPQVVSMRSVIASDKFQHAKMDLPIALGKTISNETFVVDLAKMPHLLMAGATGQGKSVGINTILTSLLYKKHPSQLKFVMVDPKKVELTLYAKIERHFLAKLPDEEEAIITDTKKVINTLQSLCKEMDTRYELLRDAMVRNIKEYNEKFIQRKLNPEKGHRYLPYIVLVIDEFADLIMTAGKEIETPIARLAQLARAIGIHLIIATQRPSTNIITGIIKANFPARIAFRVSSQIDSRTILDSGGAEQLIGRGDMLVSLGNDLIRIQCAFIDTHEVERLTEFIGSQRGYTSALLLPPCNTESPQTDSPASNDIDELFDEAARLVVQTQQGSTSLIQRKLKLGYSRAGRIMDQLETAGIVGPFEGSKSRKVLIKTLEELEHILMTLRNK